MTIGPGPDVKRAGRGAVDLGAGQVGRQEVGSELDPAKGQVKRLGQGPDGPRLGEAGHALDQNVARRPGAQ